MRKSFTTTALALFLVPMALAAQGSRTGSGAASAQLLFGSRLVAAGSIEILHGGAELVVTSVEHAVDGVRVVLAPPLRVSAQGLGVSRSITVELTLEAWDLASSALHASGHAAATSLLVAGDLVRVVALEGSAVLAYPASVGVALVVSGVVIGVILEESFHHLFHHGLHP